MNVTARLALSTTQKTILSTKIEVFKKDDFEGRYFLAQIGRENIT
jgi:hypothetical protein